MAQSRRRCCVCIRDRTEQRVLLCGACDALQWMPAVYGRQACHAMVVRCMCCACTCTGTAYSDHGVKGTDKVFPHLCTRDATVPPLPSRNALQRRVLSAGEAAAAAAVPRPVQPSVRGAPAGPGWPRPRAGCDPGRRLGARRRPRRQRRLPRRWPHGSARAPGRPGRRGVLPNALERCGTLPNAPFAVLDVPRSRCSSDCRIYGVMDV